MHYINKLKVFYTLVTLIINSLLFSQTVDPTLFNKIQYTLEEVGETSFLNGDIILINGAEYKIVPIVPNGLSSQNNPAFIQTGNNLYATPLIANGSLDISILGGVYGELELSNDYLTAKSIRQNNRDVIQDAAEFCKYYGYELFISNRYEIWQIEDSTQYNQSDDNIFNLEEGESLNIRGNKGVSKIKLYPKAKTHIWTDTDFLETGNSAGDYTLSVKEIEIEGRDFWFNWLETYPVQVNVTASGSESTIDADIYIPTSVPIRNGFWEDLEVGDKILLEESKYCQQCEGVTFVLESFDESTRTLTWAGTLVEGTNYWRDQGDQAGDDDVGDTGFWPESVKIGAKLGESLDVSESLLSTSLPSSVFNYVRYEGAERNNYPDPNSEEWGAALIGIPFKRLNEKNISSSDIQTYGAAWRDADDREDAFDFVNIEEDKEVNILFDEVVLSNWGTILSGNFANGAINFNNSIIKTCYLGVQVQRRDGVDPVSIVEMTNVKAFDLTHEKNGGGKSGNRNTPADTDQPFVDYKGQFTYNSPAVEHKFINVNVKDADGFGSQQRSASLNSAKAATKDAISVFERCKFKKSTENIPLRFNASVITSPSMPTFFKETIFDGSDLFSSGELTVSNSRFIDSDLQSYELNDPTRVYGELDDNYEFSISDSYFINSTINAGTGDDYERHINANITNLNFEETQEGLGEIILGGNNVVIKNIVVDLLDTKQPTLSSDINNNFILLQTDNISNNESTFKPDNNVDATDYRSDQNVLIKDVKIIYPSSDSLYDLNLLYMHGNIGLVNYSVVVENCNSQGSYLTGSSGKLMFKHNLSVLNTKFMRVGSLNGFKLKNLVGGIIQSGVDANNDLVFDASSGSGVYLDATNLRSIELKGQNPTGVLNVDMWNYDGEFIIIPKSDVTLTPYSINTDSNIDTDITVLKEGERYTFKHIYKGEGFLTSATKQSKTVTLVASADGTQRTWNHFNEQFDNEPDDFNWILESAVLDVGGTTYKVNSDGKVISPDGNIRGCFSNYNGLYTLYFKDAPAATTVITLTYDYYPTVDHDDYWVLLPNSDDDIPITSINTASFTAQIGAYNLVDPSSGAITATVPSGVTQVGTEFWVVDSEGTASATNSITVDFSTNGYTVSGQNTAVINAPAGGFKFIYIGNNKFIKESL